MTTESILAPVAALTLPDSTALTARAQSALAFIESMPVATADDYSLAADELRAIKTRAKAIEDQRTGITGPINKALKAINDLFRGPAELLERAEAVLKRKMLAYDQEQERIAAENRKRAEEAAAAERRRIEEQAAEARRQAQAAAEQAAAAAAAGDAQAAQLATAEAQRQAATAQAASATAQMIVAPVVLPEKVKATGISTSTRLDFEVTDLQALVQHVAAHPELLALVKADEVKLRAYVKGLGTAAKLPGVRVFEVRGMSARAA